MNARWIAAAMATHLLVSACRVAAETPTAADASCDVPALVRTRLARAIADLERVDHILMESGDEARAARFRAVAGEMRDLEKPTSVAGWSPIPELHVLGSFIGEPEPFSEIGRSVPRPAVRRVQDLEVRITHRGAPIVVALLSEYPWVRWNFKVSDGAQVVRVVLSEEQPATFTGLPLNTPTMREWRALDPQSLGWYTESDLSRPASPVGVALRELTGLEWTSYQEFASDTLTAHTFTIGPECDRWRLQYAVARHRGALEEARALLFKHDARAVLARAPVVVGSGEHRIVMRLDGTAIAADLPMPKPLTAVAESGTDGTLYGTDGTNVYRLGLAERRVENLQRPHSPDTDGEVTGIAYDARRRRLLVASRNRTGEFDIYDADSGEWSQDGSPDPLADAMGRMVEQQARDMKARQDLPSDGSGLASPRLPGNQVGKPQRPPGSEPSSLDPSRAKRVVGLTYSTSDDRLLAVASGMDGVARVAAWRAEDLAEENPSESRPSEPREPLNASEPMQLVGLGSAVALVTPAAGGGEGGHGARVAIVDPSSNDIMARWTLDVPGGTADRDACQAIGTVPRPAYVGWNGSWTANFYDTERVRWQVFPGPRSERFTASTAVGDRHIAILDRQHAYAGWLFDREKCEWSPVREAPIPGRDQAVVAWVGDALVVWNPGQPEETAVLDPVSGWRAVSAATPLGPRAVVRAYVAVGNRLYVWGGLDAAHAPCMDPDVPRTSGTIRQWYTGNVSALDDGAVFDANAARWEPLPRAPFAPGLRAVAAAWDAKPAIVQGDSVAVFDPSNAGTPWTVLRLPAETCMPAVAGADARLLVWSGCDGLGTAERPRYVDMRGPRPNDAEAYLHEWESGAWKAVPTPPLRGRWTPHMALWGDSAAVFGGSMPGSERTLRDGAILDIAGGVWRTLPPPPALEPSEVAVLPPPPTCAPKPADDFRLEPDESDF